MCVECDAGAVFIPPHLNILTSLLSQSKFIFGEKSSDVKLQFVKSFSTESSGMEEEGKEGVACGHCQRGSGVGGHGNIVQGTLRSTSLSAQGGELAGVAVTMLLPLLSLPVLNH